MKTKKKRQAMQVTIEELQDLILDLFKQLKYLKGADYKKIKFQVNIINKTPKYSDTWILER